MLASARSVLFLATVTVCVAQQAELFDAARLGDIAKLRTLASDRSIVHVLDRHQRTALHEAAAACQLEAVRFLVAQGWDRQALDDRNQTPAILASKCPDNNGQLAYFLLEGLLVSEETSEKFPWSLQYAAAHRQTTVLTMLIGMGVDVNAQGSDGNRALDVACLNGDAATSKLLLDRGANPNLRNKIGGTPLHDAALSGSRELIELLLTHGADVNSRDTQTSSTALHYAASFDRLDAVKTLLRHGADATLKNAGGLTALQLATKDNFADVSAFLGNSTKNR